MTVLLALTVALLSLLSSMAILLGSNGRPTSTWKYQPSVYLAIITAVTNTALALALSQALAVAWWRVASQDATYKTLHQQWALGHSFLGAIRSGRYAQPAFAASVASLILLVDGPLLQRASHVVSANIVDSVQLQALISPELPTGFSGNMSDSGTYVGSNAGDVRTQWMNSVPITIDTRGVDSKSDSQSSLMGCDGVCEATIQAPGLIVVEDATQSSTTPFTVNASQVEGPNVFYVDLNSLSQPGLNASETMYLEVATAAIQDCKGTLTDKLYTLAPAILQYAVTIRNQTYTFAQPAGTAKLSSLANNTQYVRNPGSDLYQATYGPLYGDVEPWFFSNTSLELDAVNPNGLTPFTMLALNYTSEPHSTCNVNFRDPTQDVLSRVNELFFRAGIMAASLPTTPSLIDHGLKVNQTFTASRTRTLNVFQSDFRWFGGAVAVQLLMILAILPLLWGWWKLDRNVSMSPLETARLIDAAALRDVNPRADGDLIAKQVGHLRIKTL